MNGADEYFNNPSKGKRSFLDMVSDIAGFIYDDPESRYSIFVGTDSEISGFIGSDKSPGGIGVFKKEGLSTANFVSAVMVHRVGKAGRYFWKKNTGIRTFDRHDRILKEAYFSLDIAHRLVAELRDKLNGHLYDFEIHLDIGQNGPTKELIQELVGMITGNGFKAKIKPESYAATSVADRHV